MTSSSPTPDAPAGSGMRRSWREALRVYLEPAALRMLVLGFSAGLPFVLVLGTLGYRLSKAGVDLAVVGFMSWIGLTYAFKFLWSPLVDGLPLPPFTTLLGRRRGWLVFAQCLIMAGVIGMALCDPQTQLRALAVCAVLTAWGSATQDIALDAFRIESALTEKQPALAAMYQSGYRVGMIWGNAGTLMLVGWMRLAQGPDYQNGAWQIAYMVMAASMAAGMFTVLLSPEPARQATPRAIRTVDQWLRDTVVAPFADFVGRYRWHAVLMLALIAVYRISDVVMGVMAWPFYARMGFTESELAIISGMFGVAMTLLGALVGGALSIRFGVMRILMLGAVLSAATNLLYAWFASRGHDVPSLVLVIMADNLAGGMASAAFIGYLSSLTNLKFSATQYAMFSSLMLLLPKFIAGYSGVFVKAHGYANFFCFTALLGIPVLGLVWLAMHMAHRRRDDAPSDASAAATARP